jgi:hypothetical protein
VSDIDIVVVDSLKALDPERPIREADITDTFQDPSLSRYDALPQVWGEHETARVHYPAWRRGGRIVTRRTRAAAGDAGNRISE